MFSQKYLAVFLAIALPSLVTAVPTSAGPSNQCNVENLMCCDTVTNSQDPVAQNMFREHNIQEPAVLTTVGLSCSPGGIVSISGTECSAGPICCTENYSGGLIGIYCSQISL